MRSEEAGGRRSGKRGGEQERRSTASKYTTIHTDVPETNGKFEELMKNAGKNSDLRVRAVVAFVLPGPAFGKASHSLYLCQSQLPCLGSVQGSAPFGVMVWVQYCSGHPRL